MTENTWLSQPAATPYGFADPVAQRRIDQLEATIGDLYRARDEAEMERDTLRAKVARVEALAQDLINCGVVSIYESALEIGEIIRRELADPEESDV